MLKLPSKEIRKRFIDFFVKHDHTEIKSSPLVLENHPSLLFVNSGMVQLTPYFLGERDPIRDFGNNKLVDTQKCIRTVDLDIIGKSKYHHTFFEMLGSWSIGAYGKKEAVEYAFDLLTNKSYGFGLDPNRFIPTVFGGSDEAPADIETIKAWESLGIKKISKLPASENWWAPGGLKGPGPCGPCTEVLYDRGPEFGPEEDTPGLTSNPRYLEIWNAGVFMQYNRPKHGAKLEELPILSVDTGAGLERISTLLQRVDSNYDTDLFKPIIENIVDYSKKDLKNPSSKERESLWRSADHIKASSFIAVEGVVPSNKDQGYVLRRLLRKIFTDFYWVLDINPRSAVSTINSVIDIYKDIFPEIDQYKLISKVYLDELHIYEQMQKNADKFIVSNYVKKGKKIIDRPFDIYQSAGASQYLIKNLADKYSLKVNFSSFSKDIKKHQELSRKNATKSFKGGLSGTSYKEIKYHTATHLLHQALREVLGTSVRQMGSNINPSRLRFDFSYPRKVENKDLKKIEDIVNKKIKEALPVKKVEMPLSEAKKTGALHFFRDKYGDIVTIYYIGNSLDSAWSKEFCGGPHVKNTSELGKFSIIKEESVSRGVRRIKAILKE